jgi:small nuclear ribonucleoprotein (snRNP)-like protein
MIDSMIQKPLDLIHKNLDSEVSITLKDGRQIRGTLIGYDTDFNLALDNAEIYDEDGKRGLGKIVLRNNNVASISPII